MDIIFLYFLFLVYDPDCSDLHDLGIRHFDIHHHDSVSYAVYLPVVQVSIKILQMTALGRVTWH